ncbi:MAG: SRPBCC family protein [Chlorobi bacterium]|nr:SRPBCC family protein [Chlorobiota bacterium]
MTSSMHRLYRKLCVEHPIEDVFAFFSRPENLERITPPELNFQILTPEPIEMKEGALIDYRIRISGLSWRWTTYIARYESPRCFVDVQLRGPYSFWHHTHTFTPLGRDATLIEDDVLYELPFGWVGVVAHRLWIHRQLQHIFDHRTAVLSQIFRPCHSSLPV